MNRTSEQVFENAIADVLLASGYQYYQSQNFDRENATFQNEADQLFFDQITEVAAQYRIPKNISYGNTN